MLKVQFTLNDFDSWELGLSSHIAEDEYGIHRSFIIGFAIVSIEFANYNI